MRIVRCRFPSLNFITLHYIYFIATCLISSVIFWGASTPPRSVRYVDALFLTVSAMTLAGLNTVNLSTLNTFQQSMLFFLIMIGSAIFVSAFVVYVRKKAFEHRFNYITEKRRRRAERTRQHQSASRSNLRRLSKSFSRSNATNASENSVTVDIDGPHQHVEDRKGSVAPAQATGNRSGDSTIIPENGTNPTPDADSSLKDESVAHSINTSGLDLPTTNVSTTHQTITYRSEADCEIHVDSATSPENGPPVHITFGPSTYHHTDVSEANHHHRFMGVGAHPHASIRRRPLTATSHAASDLQLDTMESANNHLPFTSSGFLSRNSHFHHLSEEEREQLGGYEYRAIRLLSWLVPTYYILFQFFGCIGIGAYVAINKPTVAQSNGLNPWWVGSFNAVSAFNNSGMSLLDANMVAFQTSTYMLLTMGMLILAGNTCYPIFLRLIVWTILKFLPKSERWDNLRNTLQFLLDHPRRCYTNLFPARHTWWLLSCVICLNGIDWAAFEILNIGNDAITSLPAGFEVLDGLFQALAVRSGGFYVVPIPSIRISLQILYVIMMYISVYPVVITMRNSNVYEERSLGIYADDPGYAAAQASGGWFGKLRRQMTGQGLEQTKSYFVRQQLRAQLAHDIWWIVLAVFLIMIIEGSNFDKNPAMYSVFNVIFETVSAYGCVGISVGVPFDAYSFAGSWHTLSKLVLCAVMIRGRHRGLPVAIDKAVLLPGEKVDDAEEEDGEIRMSKTISRGRIV